MTVARRQLILRFSIFLACVLSAVTGVLAYAAYQTQTSRVGDIFDRIVSERAQIWVAPTLIVIAGIAAIGIVLFLGLFIFGGKSKEDL